MPTTLSPVNLAVHLPSTAGQAPQDTKMVHHLKTTVHQHLPPSTKILLPHPHQVPKTTLSVPASPSPDVAVVLVTEDIMDITPDHIATNALAAGVDAVVAGVVVEDGVVANAAPTLAALPAIST